MLTIGKAKLKNENYTWKDLLKEVEKSNELTDLEISKRRDKFSFDLSENEILIFRRDGKVIRWQCEFEYQGKTIFNNLTPLEMKELLIIKYEFYDLDM